MPWTIATQPELDPLALGSLKAQVRESSNVFDDELTRVLAEAVDIIQSVTHRQLINATAVFTRERFPVGSAKLVLPPSPLVSVTSVSYTDTDDASQTWSNTLYDVTINTEPGYLRPKQFRFAGSGPIESLYWARTTSPCRAQSAAASSTNRSVTLSGGARLPGSSPGKAWARIRVRTTPGSRRFALIAVFVTSAA